jgi:hypothetical protein
MQLDVEVVSGNVFAPMVVTVNIFISKTEEPFLHHHLTTPPNGSIPNLVQSYSPPVGIVGIDNKFLTQVCQSHIVSMVLNPWYPEQVTAGDSKPIRFNVLKVIQEYYLGEKVCSSMLRSLRIMIC